MGLIQQHTKPYTRVQPVILCGGSGTRLWPLSRETMPKQFLKLAGEYSLFQQTIQRVQNAEYFLRPLIVTAHDMAHQIKSQLLEIGVHDYQLVLEPSSQNTAPAITLAAMVAQYTNPRAKMLVMPADHSLDNLAAFHDAVRTAEGAAILGHIVLFGIKPTRPETGYGYIKIDGGMRDMCGCKHVDYFIEKPALPAAQDMASKSGFYWNSGMFMFDPGVYLAEVAQYDETGLLDDVSQSLLDLDVFAPEITPHADAYAQVTNISVDYAVMEKTTRAVLIPAEFAWEDVGSWSAVHQLARKDVDDNVTRGDVTAIGCSNSLIHSSGRLVAAIGLNDHIVIDTEDAVLIAPKNRAQDVGRLAKELKAQKRKEAIAPAREHRPWGSFTSVHGGEQHQVKHIVVEPGGTLSSQYHHHRHEHWIVVAGEAEVTLDDTVQTLGANQSIFIPIGAVHRLANRGKTSVHLIEVQFGDYLGEDDIVRLDDVYGRAPQLIAAE